MRENSKKQTWIIGVDEVGRGPLAGPVCVCAVAMKEFLYNKTLWTGLTDSKKMSKKMREVWYKKAKELETAGDIRIALSYQSARYIDTHGINNAIVSCIKKNFDLLHLPLNSRIVLDGGLKAPVEYLYQQTIIRGDSKHAIISLASVIAKVTRDAYMEKLSKKYPSFEWWKNKGYGTKAHILSLKSEGMTVFHRRTFLTKILDI